MSEWTEVEAHGGRPAYRYRPPGVGSPEWQVEASGEWIGRPGEWTEANPYDFVAGIEAARQEIREKLENGIGLGKHLIETQRMGEEQEAFYNGQIQALEAVLSDLSPPDSETES